MLIRCILLFSLGFYSLSSMPKDNAPIVHLFEWRWNDIAQECEQVLAPLGYAAVQLSPATEHIKGNTWWTRYQPVSYKLNSRSGSREAFINMVQRCNAVNVNVYADLVINHMTSVGKGKGVTGSFYSDYNYPSVPWQKADFHRCDRPYGDIKNFNDRYEVQNCELLNLADLNTGLKTVQQVIARHINELQRLGISGFRLDAAKHIAAKDIADILHYVEGEPFIYQEVISQKHEPIKASEYFGNGLVTDFLYGLTLADIFNTGQITRLKDMREGAGLLPSDRALVFVDNHDNQRGHGGGGHVLSHKHTDNYYLANQFMLAWPHGTPRIMSSYRFNHTDSGPPKKSVYAKKGSLCGKAWVCEHRSPRISPMLSFYKQTQGQPVTHWQDNGSDFIAFSRGKKGFYALNIANKAITTRVKTQLPSGYYCNQLNLTCKQSSTQTLLAADKHATWFVDSLGEFELTIPAQTAIVFLSFPES